MKRAPTPQDYARMTDQVRYAAWLLIQEEHAAVQERRARVAALRRQHVEQARQVVSGQVVSGVIAEAARLLPYIVAKHHDVPDVQAQRRDQLDRDTVAFAPAWAAHLAAERNHA